MIDCNKSNITFTITTNIILIVYKSQPIISTIHIKKKKKTYCAFTYIERSYILKDISKIRRKLTSALFKKQSSVLTYFSN